MTDDKETRLSALHAAQNRLATIVGDRFGQTVSFDSRSTTKTKEFVHFEAKFPDAPIELLDWLTIGSGLKHDLVPPFRFFDANEVCSFYDAQIKFYEKSKNLWGSASVEWDDAIPNGDKDPKLCKRNSTWHEGWIPIADIEMDVLLVDIKPEQNGTLGQVVYAYASDYSLAVHGKSITHWLERIAERYESKVFEEFNITPQDLEMQTDEYL